MSTANARRDPVKKEFCHVNGYEMLFSDREFSIAILMMAHLIILCRVLSFN
jgi:hypothetical protein